MANDQVVVGDIPAQRPGLQPRPALLAQLNRAGQGSPVVVLTGHRGVGKTHLAAAYARARLADGWRLIAWVNARASQSLLPGLAAVAEATALSGGGPGRGAAEAGRALRQWLESDGSRCLLVFDDAEDLGLLRPFLPAAGAARVLITMAREPAESGASVPVDVFSAEEALAFLDERTRLADEVGASAVAAELGHLPLALDQAAAVIVGQHLGYAAYLEKLLTLPVEDEPVGREDGEEQSYPPGVAEAVLLSLEAARAADPVGVCNGVMEVMAVLSPASVRCDLLRDTGQTGALLGGGRRVVPSIVDQALERLNERSLLNLSLDGHAISVHCLVARVVRDELARRGRLATTYRAAATALEMSAEALAEPRDRAAVRDLLGQVTALLENAGTRGDDADEELARALRRLRHNLAAAYRDANRAVPPTPPAQPAQPARPPADPAGRLPSDSIAPPSATPLTEDETPTIVMDPILIDGGPPPAEADQTPRPAPAQEPTATAGQAPDEPAPDPAQAAEPEPEADQEPVAKQEPVAESEPESEREPEAERESAGEAVAEQEQQPEREPVAQQERAAEHEPVAEPELAARREPEAEHEPEPGRRWLEQPPADARRPRSRDKQSQPIRVVSTIATILILIVAGGVTFALVRPHTSAGSPGHAAPAAGPVEMAAEWISEQVSRSAIVACDPAMCSALEAEGVPAANLLILGVGTASPLHAQLVVATPTVRSQFGARLDSVYAPTVVAGFGSGSDRVSVQVVAPDGAAAYLAALRQDMAARQVAGAQLLANKHIATTAQARAQLAAGDVDSRLLIMLPALAAVHPIQILSFGDPGPGATSGVPLCSADLSGSGHAAGMTDASYLSWLTSFVRAQLLPFAGSMATVQQAGQPVLRVQFSRPSPLGLLGHA